MSPVLSTLRMTSRAPRLALRGVRWQHPDGHNPVPFQFRNKAAFRAGYVSILSFGFALPLVAVGWQLHKSGGSTA